MKCVALLRIWSARFLTWRTGLLFAVVAVLLPAWHAASAEEGARFSIDQVIVAQDSDSITALVSVLDATGRPVLGLTSFEASVDGASVPLTAVGPVLNADRGIAVLLLLDVSGSMAGEPLAQAKAAAKTFVQGLLERDVAAVATFAHQAPDSVVFTTDRGVLLGRITATETDPNGGTALYDAIVGGLNAEVSRAPTDRRALVLLTDGQDLGGVSEHTRDDALAAAETSGIPIFAIGVGQDADVALLDMLAQKAGGGFYAAPTPADVPAIFDIIGMTLRSQYSLELALPPGASSRRELTVSVDVDGERRTARASFEVPTTAGNAGDTGGRLAVPIGVAFVGLLAVVVVAVGAVFVRRRVRNRGALTGGRGAHASVPSRTGDSLERAAALSGRLTVVAGPHAGTSVSLAAGPVDIGSDPVCTLRLNGADNAVSRTHARVWLHSDRLMLHHLARDHETLVQGRPVEWATLEPQDTLQIGPHVIEFALDGRP